MITNQEEYRVVQARRAELSAMLERAEAAPDPSPTRQQLIIGSLSSQIESLERDLAHYDAGIRTPPPIGEDDVPSFAPLPPAHDLTSADLARLSRDYALQTLQEQLATLDRQIATFTGYLHLHEAHLAEMQRLPGGANPIVGTDPSYVRDLRAAVVAEEEQVRDWQRRRDWLAAEVAQLTQGVQTQP